MFKDISISYNSAQGLASCFNTKEHSTVEIYRSARHGKVPQLSQQFASPVWDYCEEAKDFRHGVQLHGAQTGEGEPFHLSASSSAPAAPSPMCAFFKKSIATS